MQTVCSPSFVSPERWLSQWLRTRFEAVYPEHVALFKNIRVVPSANPSFGDFQCNDAMPLAKMLKVPPRTLAQKVVETGTLPQEIKTLEIAGPGFLNITLSSQGIAEWLAAMVRHPHQGIEQVGANRTVVIDYSSPNVAKPMHIGHIRSTVIGNALDRLHRALGYRVVADNHIGDWGTQFGIIIAGYRAQSSTDIPICAQNLDGTGKNACATLSIENLERIYVESYAKAKDDPEWMEHCRAELVKLQAGDSENKALWQEFVAVSLGEFARIYKRLGVSFDITRGESYYNDALLGVVKTLEDMGIATESDGATIVNLEAEGLGVCIVRKRDGGFNYATTDIATVRSRVTDFAPEKIVYVTDERQQLHFKQFFSVCRKMGIPETTQLEHVWFGLMRLPEGTFSTRQGNVIKLEALLDEAESRALAILKETRPDMPEADAKALAASIGIGAIKYADLSQSPQTLITFSWEKAMALEGNSGPYLQYAHARICSVMDKYRAQFPGRDLEESPFLREPSEVVEGDRGQSSAIERTLALKILQYPMAVSAAAENYKPSVLADYLFDLAQTYSSFYQQVPFLKAPEGVRESRVRLCGLFAQVLRHGLYLLGIETPERI